MQLTIELLPHVGGITCNIAAFCQEVRDLKCTHSVSCWMSARGLFLTDMTAVLVEWNIHKLNISKFSLTFYFSPRNFSHSRSMDVHLSTSQVRSVNNTTTWSTLVTCGRMKWLCLCSKNELGSNGQASNNNAAHSNSIWNKPGKTQTAQVNISTRIFSLQSFSTLLLWWSSVQMKYRRRLGYCGNDGGNYGKAESKKRLCF